MLPTTVTSVANLSFIAIALPLTLRTRMPTEKLENQDLEFAQGQTTRVLIWAIGMLCIEATINALALAGILLSASFRSDVLRFASI
jgi:hypothetical protein